MSSTQWTKVCCAAVCLSVWVCVSQVKHWSLYSSQVVKMVLWGASVTPNPVIRGSKPHVGQRYNTWVRASMCKIKANLKQKTTTAKTCVVTLKIPSISIL